MQLDDEGISGKACYMTSELDDLRRDASGGLARPEQHIQFVDVGERLLAVGKRHAADPGIELEGGVVRFDRDDTAGSPDRSKGRRRARQTAQAASSSCSAVRLS